MTSIIIPFDKDIHSKESLEKTLRSIIINDKINIYIISKSEINYPNCNNIIFNFDNIFMAYNKAIEMLNTGYFLFIVPGDLIHNNFKHINFNDYKSEIIQFAHDRIKDTGEIYSPKHTKIKSQIYDLDIELPNNLNILCDKVYSCKFLRNNNILFDNFIQSAYFFNLKCLELIEKFTSVDTKIITHQIGVNIGNLSTNPKDGFNIIKNIITEKDALYECIDNIKKQLLEEIHYKNIDFVFPYVSSDDTYWQKIYSEYFIGKENDWATGIERFRDNGMLKYLFRSLEKHLPWINKVYMIVMSKSQVPEWLNLEYVDIITHDEFIPKEFLPTFNSSTIEMFLPLLPRVSNNFIYSNDDLITFKDLSPDYFFKYDKPTYNINIRNFKKTAPGDTLRRNAYNLILGVEQGKRVVTTQHATISYKKDWILNCYNKYKDKILNSITRFRDEKNYNQYLYGFYQMTNNVIENSSKDIVSYTVKKNQIKKILKDDFSSHDFVCINDDNNASKEHWEQIINKIDKLLPNKSKYEV